MDHAIDWDSVPLVEKNTSSGGVDDIAPQGPTRRFRWDFLVFTLPFFGLQLAFTAQQVYGIPYLSSLGVSSGHMPFFVMSGPVAGLVGPPVVAALSEMPWCRNRRWGGRRRPFIFLGGMGIILSFLVLAAAEPLAMTLAYTLSGGAYNTRAMAVVIAGLALYALNFSAQPLQLGLRASVVDHFGPHEQPTANLYISRFSALGSIFIALVGLGYSPAFWDLAVVSTSVLALLLGLSALTAFPSNKDASSSSSSGAPPAVSLRGHLSRLLRTARHLPPVTRRTCRVQLVSWFAWFPLLNYASAIVSRVYDKLPPSASAGAVSRVALLFHACSLATLVAVSIAWRQRGATATQVSSTELEYTRHPLVRRVWKPCLLALAASLTVTCLLVLFAKSNSSSAVSGPAAVAICVFLGANGAVFALANWVPYALIAEEASTRARARARSREQVWASTWIAERASTAGAGAVSASGDGVGLEGDGNDDDDTPTFLAVHNMSITAPQIAASGATWLLMQGLSVLGFEQHPVWVLVMSIPAALWAACL